MTRDRLSRKRIILREVCYFSGLLIFLSLMTFLVNFYAPIAVSHAEAQSDSKVVDRDNSAINKRDTTNHTLTPEDQALGTPQDVEKTRKIRERLTRDNALSTYAKNVKIITLNGVTTLRGPVKSREESLFVERVAKSISATVENKLEVATK